MNEVQQTISLSYPSADIMYAVLYPHTQGPSPALETSMRIATKLLRSESRFA